MKAAETTAAASLDLDLDLDDMLTSMRSTWKQAIERDERETQDASARRLARKVSPKEEEAPSSTMLRDALPLAVCLGACAIGGLALRSSSSSSTPSAAEIRPDDSATSTPTATPTSEPAASVVPAVPTTPAMPAPAPTPTPTAKTPMTPVSATSPLPPLPPLPAIPPPATPPAKGKTKKLEIRIDHRKHSSRSVDVGDRDRDRDDDDDRAAATRRSASVRRAENLNAVRDQLRDNARRARARKDKDPWGFYVATQALARVHTHNPTEEVAIWDEALPELPEPFHTQAQRERSAALVRANAERLGLGTPVPPAPPPPVPMSPPQPPQPPFPPPQR